MADTITFRPDEDAARALAVLTRDGTPVSSAAARTTSQHSAVHTSRSNVGVLSRCPEVGELCASGLIPLPLD